ncbi:MAG: hypothetical protein ACSHW0_17160 [Thalassotalea sp.]
MRSTFPLENVLNLTDIREYENALFKTPFIFDETDPLWYENTAIIAVALEEYYEYVNLTKPINGVSSGYIDDICHDINSGVEFYFSKDHIDLESDKIRERLFEFYLKFGCEATIKSFITDFPLEFNAYKNNEHKIIPQKNLKNSHRAHSKNKLYQVIDRILEKNPNASINDVWMYFYNNQGEEVFDLIEITKVTDTTNASAKIEWDDIHSGKEGRTTSRKSVSNRMSVIRNKFK